MQASRWLLPIIILAALAIRMAVVYFTYGDLPYAEEYLSHPQFGWEMGWEARALASGRGFSSPFFPWSGPTAWHAPFYPYILSVVFRLFGIYSLTSGFVILSINSLLSALTCIPVYFSAKYSLGARGAMIAAWVWAFYPFAIYFSAGRVWEYALTSLLFATCFCIAQRIHRTASPIAWLGWGALYGIAALSNPAVLSTLPFLLLLSIWRLRNAGRRWLLNATLTVLATIAVLTPWTVRNYRALGVLCPVRDNFWLEFYAENSGDPSLNPLLPHPGSNPAELQKYLSMGEPAYMAEKHILAVDYLKSHPRFVAQKTLRRIFYYWSGYWSFSADELQREPYSPANVLYCCGMTLLMLRGARRLWRWNRTAALPYLALIGVYPLIYYVTMPLMDYRQPIEPAIIVLAVSGALPWRRIQPSRFVHWIGAERAREPEFAVTTPAVLPHECIFRRSHAMCARLIRCS